MRRGSRSVTCLLAVTIAGCGGGDDPPAATATTTTAAPTPQVVAGERVLAGAGCLACHQIGTRGNSGPGDNLAGIGARRSPAQIRRALLNAKAPMPSYAQLPPEDLDALVAYLADLRDNGGGACPDDGDCG